MLLCPDNTALIIYGEFRSSLQESSKLFIKILTSINCCHSRIHGRFEMVYAVGRITNTLIYVVIRSDNMNLSEYEIVNYRIDSIIVYAIFKSL